MPGSGSLPHLMDENSLPVKSQRPFQASLVRQSSFSLVGEKMDVFKGVPPPPHPAPDDATSSYSPRTRRHSTVDARSRGLDKDPRRLIEHIYGSFDDVATGSTPT